MKRILIVEDALDLGRMLRLALETLDRTLSVRVIQSAEEALLELSGSPPVALIISDIRLPGMSGFDLLKKVRLRSPETRIMLITGLSDEQVTRQAAEAKVDRFMRKPIEMSEFLRTAAELLELPLPAEQPPETADASEPLPQPREDLPGLLTRLRRELGAVQVLLCDDRGRVVAQAGEVGEVDFEQHWAPPIMAALSALVKANRLVRSGLPQAALALRGEPRSLILAPVGGYGLVIVQEQDGSGLRTALAFEAVLQAQSELAAILRAMQVDFYPMSDAAAGTSSPSPAATPAVEEVISSEEPLPLEELEVQLQRTAASLDPNEVDSFWESAAEQQVLEATNPDALSYEQARQLGLAPEDDNPA
ncbi:response regulator containing CheY-like receiver, AAA-type ATPase, and DNA-binding domains [Bellilinea caldifistulae]|uniref:response regulator n=1 Tax=Bellilinea caldifistulae TaxID=360411 RepID=UPI0007821D7F|nr:response regulator [Bellilinea caldifistulae]GAP08909.1 response regulator containing CheY-like receiver, AAA-type ATPase, and DNA-binding domains [Bellilinea caldifistulae]